MKKKKLTVEVDIVLDGINEDANDFTITNEFWEKLSYGDRAPHTMAVSSAKVRVISCEDDE